MSDMPEQCEFCGRASYLPCRSETTAKPCCERIEAEARRECDRQGIDPDELCADGGIEAWMVVAKEMKR